MKKIFISAFLFCCLNFSLSAQAVERPKVPADTVLASKTSQIAAWYRYAVYVEGLLAAEKAGKNDVSQNTLILAKLNTIEQYMKFSIRVQTIIKTNLVLNWIDNSDNEAGFIVERSSNGINFITIATVSPNITTYTDIGLDVGIYYYRVSSYNTTGTSTSTIVRTN